MDFVIYLIGGEWQWEGKGFYCEYCSDRGFTSANAAAEDAISYLATVEDE